MPDVGEVYRMLLQEESHRELKKEPTIVETAAFGVERKRTREKRAGIY